MESSPIIVFGTGRSGTTIFQQMLSEHPDLIWLSRLSNKYPDKLVWNRALMRVLDFPVLNGVFRSRFHPSESYAFWDYYYKGFSYSVRDLLATDVTVKSKHKIQCAMSEMTKGHKKKLLLKITGWPRLGFLLEIFENAKFIHIIRDGRSVANSLINVKFWQGWKGPENWGCGPLSSLHNEVWNKYNQSFIVLAAIQWQIHMDAVEEAKKYVKKSNLMEIKYEELCFDPIAVLKEISEFCDIEWTSYFEKRLRKYEVKNMNNKWEHELNINQKRELNEVLREYLAKYGYL